jgi:hypothetical protein
MPLRRCPVGRRRRGSHQWSHHGARRARRHSLRHGLLPGADLWSSLLAITARTDERLAVAGDFDSRSVPVI